MRRWLNETPVFVTMRAQRAERAYPLLEVLRVHRRTLLPAAALTCVLTTAVIIPVVVTPTLLQQHFAWPAKQAFALGSLGIVFLNLGCVIAGRVTDRIGPVRSLALYSLLLPLGVGLLYASLIGGWRWPGLAYALTGLCCGIVGVVPSAMISLFPADIRVSGIAITYNIAYSLWASAAPCC